MVKIAHIFLAFLGLFIGGICACVAQKISVDDVVWDLNPDLTTMKVSVLLKDDLPDKIEFLVGTYQASGSLKYSENLARVGNIRWGGTFNIDGYGGSMSVSLEESIFKKNGTLKPIWDKRMRKEITKSILKELSFLMSD